MPSDNNANGAVLPEKGKNSKKDKKHGKKSIGWIIGVIVLILISVTFILPVTVFSTSNTPKITFGSYNGEDITLEYTYDNYFYNILVNLANMYQMNNQNVMQIYQTAFSEAVMNTALTQMADEAGITVSDKMLGQAMVQSGNWRDENGNFDVNAYNETPQVQRDAVRDQLRAALPAQVVLSDLATVKTSNAEQDFVMSLSSSPRAFQYITLDYNAYPDEDAISYAAANPAPFMTMDLSVITVATEDEANTVLTSIQNGETTFADAVTASSTDSYKGNGGSMGTVIANDLESTLVNEEDALTVFSLSEGELSAPIQSYTGWQIFRADSTTAEADTSDADVLSDIKRYISLNDSETMETFLQAKADEVYAAAQNDFEKAASDNNLKITDVSASSYNPASAAFITGIAGNDPDGLLLNATYASTEYQSEIFTAADNTVIAPELSGSSYIIVRPVAAAAASDTANRRLAYSQSAPVIAVQDVNASILSSDGFVDNFFNTFISEVIGASAN